MPRETPLAICFVLGSPVILTEGASLDAVVAYQGFAAGGDGLELLDCAFAKSGRVHCASWLFYEDQHIVTETQLVRMQRVGAALNENTLSPSGKSKYPFRIDNQRNEAQNKLNRYEAISSPALWAFARGDVDVITSALSDITSLGKQRPYGYGRVTKIEIHTANDWDDAGIKFPDGTPSRAIPIEDWEGEAKKGAYSIGFPRWVALPEVCAIPDNKSVDTCNLTGLPIEKSWVLG